MRRCKVLKMYGLWLSLDKCSQTLGDLLNQMVVLVKLLQTAPASVATWEGLVRGTYTLTNKDGITARLTNFLLNQVAQRSRAVTGLVRIRLTPPSWDKSGLSQRSRKFNKYGPILPQILKNKTSACTAEKSPLLLRMQAYKTCVRTSMTQIHLDHLSVSCARRKNPNILISRAWGMSSSEVRRNATRCREKLLPHGQVLSFCAN